MEQCASQVFQDKSVDLRVVMHSSHNEKYSDMMGRFYEAFALKHYDDGPRCGQ